jgi:acetoin utilization deacetylase AcuC-like enzyme
MKQKTTRPLCVVVHIIVCRCLMNRCTNALQSVGFSMKRPNRFSSLASICSIRGVTSSTEATALKQPKPFFPIYYNDVYEVQLPPNHRFPMEKYRKVRENIQARINALPPPHAVDCEFRISPLATFEEIALTHCPKYIQRFLTGDITEQEQRNVGFPWSPSGVKRATSSAGGTVAAAVTICEELQRQLEQQQEQQSDTARNLCSPLCWGAHVAGGTHHSFYDYGEGFCVFSDIAVAANVVLTRFPDLIRRILILDLDVHQGNGNAVLFQNRPEVFTFSLHCTANYFSDKQESDLDIELPVGCNDVTYLATLRHWLKQIKTHSGEFDLIFFQAGVDISEHDRLGRMGVTALGLRRRNDMVYDFAANEMKLPLVITMGGGYPRTKDWTPILDAHSDVYLQALEFLSKIHRKR